MKTITNKNLDSFKLALRSLLFVACISLIPALGHAGQFVDSIMEELDKIPTVAYCANVNPDRIRLVKKSWTCVLNKARLVHSAGAVLSHGKSYEKLNNENTPRGRYLLDRIDHHFDRAKEADYQLRRNKCTRACF